MLPRMRVRQMKMDLTATWIAIATIFTRPHVSGALHLITSMPPFTATMSMNSGGINAGHEFTDASMLPALPGHPGLCVGTLSSTCHNVGRFLSGQWTCGSPSGPAHSSAKYLEPKLLFVNQHDEPSKPSKLVGDGLGDSAGEPRLAGRPFTTTDEAWLKIWSGSR